jgi:P27 family predicted phage terminase small subunit
MIAKKCPEPPAHLSQYGAQEWRRVSGELHRLGLLTILDETSLACYCSAYAVWRCAEEQLAQEGDLVVPGSERNKVQNPLVKIGAQAARDAIKFGSEFGLTPSARVCVAAGVPPSPPSKFKDLLA